MLTLVFSGTHWGVIQWGQIVAVFLAFENIQWSIIQPSGRMKSYYLHKVGRSSCEQNKPDLERQISHVFSHMWSLGKVKRWHKIEERLLEKRKGIGEEGKEGGEAMWEMGNGQNMLHTCTHMSKWYKPEWNSLLCKASIWPNNKSLWIIWLKWNELHFDYPIIF